MLCLASHFLVNFWFRLLSLPELNGYLSLFVIASVFSNNSTHLPLTQALRSAGESGVTAATLNTPARWEARQPANEKPNSQLRVQTLIYTQITPLAARHLQRACSHSLNYRTGLGMLRTADHSPTFRVSLWGSQHTGCSLHCNQHGNLPSARGTITKPVLSKWEHHWMIHYRCLRVFLYLLKYLG